jgi:hypothetical protein
MELGFKTDEPPISSSGMSDYYKCKRYFMFRYRLGLVQRLSAATAAVEGEWLHEVLRQLTLGETIDVIRGRLFAAVNAKVDEATDSNGVSAPGLDEALMRMANKALAMGEAFSGLCRDKHLAIANPATTEVIAVENELQAEVMLPRNHTVLVKGTLDLVTRNRINGEITIHDYKKSSKEPILRALTARLETQPWVYRLLAESAFGAGVKWFCNWILRSPTIRRHKATKNKPEETYDEYLKRVVQWYTDEAVKSPESPPIVSSTITLDDQIITPARMNMLVEVSKAGQGVIDADDFPPTGAPYYCEHYGRMCPYHQLCVSDPAMWPSLVLESYRQEFRYGAAGDGSGSESESEV